MTLPAYNDLTVDERRSFKKMYERIRTEVNGTSPTPTPEVYYFISYADAEGKTEWGSGTVEPTGIRIGDYVQVKVKTNTPKEEFVGQKFFVTKDIKFDGSTIYECFTNAGTTSAGFYVKVSTTEFEEETVEETTE